VYGQALPLAVTYLREEPDALMSARPGLCGGYRVSGIPTAINEQYSLLRLRLAVVFVPWVCDSRLWPEQLLADRLQLFFGQ
jgi:hypothetical protein